MNRICAGLAQGTHPTAAHRSEAMAAATQHLISHDLITRAPKSLSLTLSLTLTLTLIPTRIPTLTLTRTLTRHGELNPTGG